MTLTAIVSLIYNRQPFTKLRPLHPICDVLIGGTSLVHRHFTICTIESLKIKHKTSSASNVNARDCDIHLEF